MDRIITPSVRDVASGAYVDAGPAIDDTPSWNLYRRDHPTRLYAIAKRVLSRRELRRHGLQNPPPEEGLDRSQRTRLIRYRRAGIDFSNPAR